MERKKEEGTGCFCLQPGSLTLLLVAWPCSLWVGLAGIFHDLSDIAPSLNELTGSSLHPSRAAAQPGSHRPASSLSQMRDRAAEQLISPRSFPSIWTAISLLWSQLLISTFLACFILQMEAQPTSLHFLPLP